MQNFIQDGADPVTITAPIAVVGGQGLLVGSLFGICGFSAAQGQPLELWVTGAFQLPKNTTDVWAIGTPIYWDNVNLVATSTVGANVKIGIAIAAAANPSTSGNVRLNGSV